MEFIRVSLNIIHNLNLRVNYQMPIVQNNVKENWEIFGVQIYRRFLFIYEMGESLVRLYIYIYILNILGKVMFTHLLRYPLVSTKSSYIFRDILKATCSWSILYIPANIWRAKRSEWIAIKFSVLTNRLCFRHIPNRTDGVYWILHFLVRSSLML